MILADYKYTYMKLVYEDREKVTGRLHIIIGKCS